MFQKHIVSWSQLLEIGRELPDGMLEDRLIRIGINQCCSIVYTADSDSPTKGGDALSRQLDMVLKDGKQNCLSTYWPFSLTFLMDSILKTV